MGRHFAAVGKLLEVHSLAHIKGASRKQSILYVRVTAKSRKWKWSAGRASCTLCETQCRRKMRVPCFNHYYQFHEWQQRLPHRLHAPEAGPDWGTCDWGPLSMQTRMRPFSISGAPSTYGGRFHSCGMVAKIGGSRIAPPLMLISAPPLTSYDLHKLFHLSNPGHPYL